MAGNVEESFCHALFSLFSLNRSFVSPFFIVIRKYELTGSEYLFISLPTRNGLMSSLLFASSAINLSLVVLSITNASTKQGGYFEYKPMYFSRAPIPQATDKQKKEIITQVDLLLKLNVEKQTTKLPTKLDQLQTQITHAENKINQLVYKLYDLSEEEISIIEKSI